MTTMTEQEARDWIDNASYEQLLMVWRFAPTGDPRFIGDIGKHYLKVLARKRKEIGDEAHTATSKFVGWDVNNARLDG